MTIVANHTLQLTCTRASGVQRQLGVIARSQEPPYPPELVGPLRRQLDTIEKELGNKVTEKLYEEAGDNWRFR